MQYPFFGGVRTFRVLSRSPVNGARAGWLETRHGTVETPALLPVATRAAVRGLTSAEVGSTGAPGLIVNALHLWLKDRVQGVTEAGGLHGFMGWRGPIFTDSGGFQIIRRDFAVQVKEEGLLVRGPRGPVLMTPEGSVDLAAHLRADVAIVLDHCPPYGRSHRHHAEAAARTERWAKRCLASRSSQGPALFGVVQGGTFSDLRSNAGSQMAELDFDGFAIGGLSIGEPREAMFQALKAAVATLPPARPRHLLGVGSPLEILDAVASGVDLFDSSFPTRNARHGVAYTLNGPLALGRRQNERSDSPLVDDCPCPACRDHPQSYLYHLLREGDPLAGRLLSLHNLTTMARFMASMRKAILADEFREFRERFRKAWRVTASAGGDKGT